MVLHTMRCAGIRQNINYLLTPRRSRTLPKAEDMSLSDVVAKLAILRTGGGERLDIYSSAARRREVAAT
jgi:hypothetical protein